MNRYNEHHQRRSSIVRRLVSVKTKNVFPSERKLKKIIEWSKQRGDDMHNALESQSSNKCEFAIQAHKNCVPS